MFFSLLFSFLNSLFYLLNSWTSILLYVLLIVESCNALLKLLLLPLLGCLSWLGAWRDIPAGVESIRFHGWSAASASTNNIMPNTRKWKYLKYNFFLQELSNITLLLLFQTPSPGTSPVPRPCRWSKMSQIFCSHYRILFPLLFI